MGILVRLHKRLAQKGGNVKLAAVPGVVAQVIRLVRLDRIFQIFPTVDEALASFHGEETD
jgi:anti-anti-sigma factor